MFCTVQLVAEPLLLLCAWISGWVEFSAWLDSVLERKNQQLLTNYRIPSPCWMGFRLQYISGNKLKLVHCHRISPPRFRKLSLITLSWNCIAVREDVNHHLIFQPLFKQDIYWDLKASENSRSSTKFVLCNQKIYCKLLIYDLVRMELAVSSHDC